MNREAIRIFTVQQRVFGITPCCGDFFRLSDCRVFLRRAPRKTWLDRLIDCQERLEQRRTDFEAQVESLRQAGREAGRRRAQSAIRKVDTVFAPRHLSADDAKALCHPVDYVVFRGMNSGPRTVSRVVLLDREAKSRHRERLQQSIERVVRRGDVSWHTLRVANDGSVRSE